ncbi:unnamed protein product [Cylindrotheca closterium]|uniref:Uncharacterized protein n=1 Tax=Cylindrotheca closterium TaxID=2856 RepID=A0AAD2FIV7_9STRA|nr:unnamed protein product [Cylindrotheca closterium]
MSTTQTKLLQKVVGKFLFYARILHSDASYLTEAKARSRVDGHFYMGSAQQSSTNLNGPILGLTKIIKAIVSSPAAEAKVGALFYNCKEAISIRTLLTEMDHPQPATPVQVDNSTAVAIVNNRCRQVRSKAIDMRYYWVQDRVKQGQFNIFWAPGPTNLGDYYTKHHPIHHHQTHRPIMLHSKR